MKKKTKINPCACLACQVGVEEAEVQFHHMMETYGHVVRYVKAVYEFEGTVYPSIYTVGLTTQGFPFEIECVLRLSEKSAGFLLNQLAFKVKNGTSFKLNTIYRLPEFNHAPFYFIATTHPGGKLPLWRMILSDPAFRLPQDDGCQREFLIQEFIGMPAGTSLS